MPSPRLTFSKMIKAASSFNQASSAGHRTLPIAITTISNIQSTQTIGHFPKDNIPTLMTSPYKVSIKSRKLRVIEHLYSNTNDSCIEVYWYILIKRCFFAVKARARVCHVNQSRQLAMFPWASKQGPLPRQDASPTLSQAPIQLHSLINSSVIKLKTPMLQKCTMST